MQNFDGAILKFLTNKMTVSFNMLSSLVENWIEGDVNGSLPAWLSQNKVARLTG